MHLVLLHRFRKSGDSLPGYKLCEKLLKEGYQLLVTTTAKNEDAEREQEEARKMSKKWSGNITLLKPQCEELEEPSPEWIAKLHRTYFGYLSQLKEVNFQTVIGILPGTAKTAVDLKKTLHCKLVLLAATKIETSIHDLSTEVNSLIENADEVWSIGPDLYSHFDEIFQTSRKNLSQKHKQIVFKPDGTSKKRNGERRSTNSVSSIWNSGQQLYFQGRKMRSKGSCQHSFKSLAKALARINEDYRKMKIPELSWFVHGLADEENGQKSFRKEMSDNAFLVPVGKPKSFNDVMKKLSESTIFIVPDEREETFNFTALEAMSQGIPTLVSSQSSIGKFLQTHSIPCRDRVTVDLTGNPESDTSLWIEKVNEFYEVLSKSKTSVPLLDKYFCDDDNDDLWTADFSILDAPSSSPTIEPVTKVNRSISPITLKKET